MILPEGIPVKPQWSNHPPPDRPPTVPPAHVSEAFGLCMYSWAANMTSTVNRNLANKPTSYSKLS